MLVAKLVKLLEHWALQMFWQWQGTLSAKALETSGALGEPQQITHYACTKRAKCPESWEITFFSPFVQKEPSWEVHTRLAP